EYLDKQNELETRQDAPAKTSVATPAPTPASEAKAQRMTYHEKKEWAVILEQIDKTEQRIEEIKQEMNKITNDAGRLIDLQEELEQSDETLLEFYERYD